MYVITTTQVFPKAPKLQASQATLARQDTIDEGGEVEASPPSRETRLVIEGSGTTSVLVPHATTTKDRNLTMEREWQIEMASSRATTSDTYDTGLREQPPTLAQRDLIATVLDLKVDVRLEMQRMQSRIGRIEDLLNELIKRLQQQDSSNQTTPGEDASTATLLRRPGQAMTSATTPGTTTNSDTVITISMTPPTTSAATSTGGNGLGNMMLKKRRSKTRKAPAPPKQLSALISPTSVLATSAEEQCLLEQEPTIVTTVTTTGDDVATTTCVVTTASGSDVYTAGSGKDASGGCGKREFL